MTIVNDEDGDSQESNAYMLSMTGVEVHDNEDEDDSTKAMRPPTRSRPRCFAVRQCSHCHHQSLVMMLMMLMTMITMVMWQLWSFMMAMMIMMTMMSNIQDLFFGAVVIQCWIFQRTATLICMSYFETLMQQWFLMRRRRTIIIIIANLWWLPFCSSIVQGGCCKEEQLWYV